MHTLDAITYFSNNVDIKNNSLKRLRLNNPKTKIFSYLNINFIKNEMGSLQDVVVENVDILAIAETKTDESFLTAQFFNWSIINLIDLINSLKLVEFLLMCNLRYRIVN